MCTMLTFKCKNGDAIVARTMDFARNAGEKYAEFTAVGKIPYKAKFSRYGFGEISLDVVCDGLNRDGLSVEALWLPEPYTAYSANLSVDKFKETIFLPQHLLSTCSSVAEVKNAMQGFVASIPTQYIAVFLTIHISVTDLAGNSIVIEFQQVGDQKGVPVIHDNPVGVLTNAPSFDWHLNNLDNYVNIDSFNTSSNTINNLKINATGYGSNLTGLLGDSTPPSRFVMMSILLNLALNYRRPSNYNEAASLAVSLISKAVVVPGTTITKENLQNKVDYTQWIVLKNLKDYKYSEKTYNSLSFKELG